MRAEREPGPVDPVQGRVDGVRLYSRATMSVRWLAGHVVPPARRLRAGGALVHLRRGWRFGPHVDLIAHAGRPPLVDWAAVAAGLDAGDLPAGGGLTEGDYLDQARESGRFEAVPPPYLPMRPHGDVELLTAADAGSLAPLGPLTGIVSGVLCGPLLDTAEELAAHPDRAVTRLVEVFVALADTHVLGAGHGVFSLRSHTEAFLAWAAPTRDMRPVFAARLAAEGRQLRAAVEQRLDGAPGPAAAAWRTAFGYSAGVLDSAVAAGTLTGATLDAFTDGLDTTRMGPPGAPEAGPAGASPDSAFHRAVDASGVVAEPSEFFAAYRMLVNLLYQQLPLLTVSPMQRWYTCYAVAETVDEVLGESWTDRLARTAAARSAS